MGENDLANRLKKESKIVKNTTAISWLIAVFLMFMFVFFPLYAGGGYTVIDTTKYNVYKVIVITGLSISFIVAIWSIVKKKAGEDWNRRLSIVDMMVLAYAVIVLLSICFSDFKKAALLGQAGWYMGGMTLISCCLIYFMVSRFYSENTLVNKCILDGSFIVFLLGALNRFGYWPIDLEIPYQYDFISTIGNIGWYCGFLAVVAPFGMGIYILRDDLDLQDRIMLGIYIFVVFFTGSSQGGDTIYVFYGVLLVGLICLCGFAECGLNRFLEIIMLWCGSILLIALIRAVNPESYHFETDNLCGHINSGLIGLWILIPVAAVYLILVIKKINVNYKILKYIGIAFAGIGVLALLFGIVIVFISAKVKFGDLEISDDSILSKLVIGYEWGNGRGATMMMGAECFLKQNFIHKILGVGPDCLASTTYYDEQLSAVSVEIFGEAMVTNAHNEIITNLVHMGLAGTVAYYGTIATYMIRCIRQQNKMTLTYALCVLCSTGYAMFNYSHILNLPFLFIMIAIGEGATATSKK